jgi:hypothetical protein
MKFLADNWAQISFLLLAIGYVIKIIVDSVFKKKEIRYNFFLNNRMKSIEKFLSDYSSLESSFSDTSTSYINKLLSAKETDNIIVPLRYKLTDSLATLQLYVSAEEYEGFSKVYSNFLFLMNKVSRLKYDTALDDFEKGNEHSDLLRHNKDINKTLLQEIISTIQKELK